MTFPRRAWLSIAAVSLLAACDSSDNPLPFFPTGEVRFIHAVPDAPEVIVRNSAQPLADRLDFAEATRFEAVDDGELSVQVDAIVPGGFATVIGPVDIDIDADTSTSVIAVGQAAPGGVAPIAPLVITHPDTPVGAGNVRLEAVHAAPSAPPVDIYVTAPGTDLADASPIAGGSTPFGANSGQLEVPAGDYRIRVTPPGSDVPLFDSGALPLPAGADLLVLALDNTGPGSAPITLLAADGSGSFEILDTATPAEVRVVHAVADAPDVDVYVNDPMAMSAPAIQGLAYREIAPGADDYIELDAGGNNLLVTVAGNPGAIAIPATDVTLEAGQQYTVYASGTLATIAPFIALDDDRSVVTEARVRILHMSPSAGPVDIYVTAPGADITAADPTIADFAPLDDTGYLGLAGGSYDVTVTVAGTKTAAIGPVTIVLSDGDVYTAVATDPDPDVPNDSFGLVLLDDF